MCCWEEAGSHEQTARDYEAQYPLVGRVSNSPLPTENQSSVTPTDLTSALQRAISEASSFASSSGDEPPAV
jgi:hypothetical protein